MVDVFGGDTAVVLAAVRSSTVGRLAAEVVTRIG